MSRREKVIEGISTIANSITKDGWTASKERAISKAAGNYNSKHEDEIFVQEFEDGICIEDDIYKFERY